MTVPSQAEDSPDSAPLARPLRSMQTGQNSIAPENSLPQPGQVRWGSVFIDHALFPRRLKLRNEHGFPGQPAAAPVGNQAPGSEPLAIPSSTERCETRRRPLLASCGRVPILTSCRSKTRVSHAIRVRHYETVLVVETARDSSEIFNGIILVSYRFVSPIFRVGGF